MRRAQLFEFHDLWWFPASARDTMTDFMSWFATSLRVFKPVVPILSEALRHSRAGAIVDLCSGGGGPAVAVRRAMAEHSETPPTILTDKYPNLDAFRRTHAATAGGVSFATDAVDAASVPPSLRGFRTLYASFHHFAPPAARAILADAVNHNEGIAVFEYTERNFWVWGPALAFTPPLMILAMPFVRPFRWSHLFWTWLIPFFLLAVVWDGLVSCLRTYTPAELLALTPEVSRETFEWRSGRLHAFGGCYVTYLVGWPRTRGQA